MRQVGDRLIPVGVTSGRVQVLSSEEAAAAAADGGSRRNRRRPNQQNGAYEQYVGMGGQDLEEVSFYSIASFEVNLIYLQKLMLMEAMRLSLLDHEEHQRKEAEEKKKQEAVATATAAGVIQGIDGPGPGPSTLEGRQSLLDTSSSLSSASSISRSASPPIPTHTKVGSQDSLTPNKTSWSFSRCRTPPPPSSSAGPSASNSSPAALLAATTPSSGHEKWASRSITPEPGNRNPAPFQPSGARRVSLDNSMPIIALSNDRTITPRVSENNNTKPSVPLSNVNLWDQQTPSTSQTTTSTSTSTTNELGSGALSHVPSLDFEANVDSSKGHPY